jgi:hypothetical protein
MKTSARQRALSQKKRRIESRIVGQHITDEPSTNAHEACYAIRTLVIVTVGARHSALLRRLDRCRARVSPALSYRFSEADIRFPRSAGPVSTPQALDLTQSMRSLAMADHFAVHAVYGKASLAGADGNRGNCGSHRFHSVTAATGFENKNDGQTSEASSLAARPSTKQH